MSYLWLKHLHVLTASVSLLGFALRGWWMWQQSPWLQHKLTRVIPHVVDTLLLLAAIGLMVSTARYPFVEAWLTAKVFALVVYILLGTLALKRGRTRKGRATAWLLALLTFAYMVGVALTKNPWSWWVY